MNDSRRYLKGWFGMKRGMPGAIFVPFVIWTVGFLLALPGLAIEHLIVRDAKLGNCVVAIVLSLLIWAWMTFGFVQASEIDGGNGKSAAQ